MSSPKDFLLSALSGAEDAIERSLGALSPFTILPYRGFGNHETVKVTGRLLKDERIEQPHEDDPVWKNVWTMVKHYESD